MNLLTEEDIKAWLKAHSLCWEDAYGTIDYPPGTSDSRFWVRPWHGARIVYFLKFMLNALDPWESLIICKQGGTGWRKTGSPNPMDDVYDLVVGATGVPDYSNGALRFTRTDETALLTLLLIQLLFGWCMWDDVYVIPDHADQFIKTSHHDVVHVHFRDTTRVEPYVRAMEAAEFYLPTEPPDETFKTPHWMVGG
jgi:hypothetical protein